MELDSAVGLLILQLLRCLANFFQNFQVLLRNAQSEILELVVGLILGLCIHPFFGISCALPNMFCGEMERQYSAWLNDTGLVEVPEISRNDGMT